MASEFIEIISEQTKAQIDAIMPLVEKLANKIKDINNFQPVNTPSGADSAIKKLTEDYAKQSKEIENLKNKLASLNEEGRKKAVITTQQKVDNAIILKQEKQQATLTSAYADAYAKLNAQRTIAKTKLQDLIASERASNSEIRKAQKEFDVLNKKVAAADKAVGRFSDANRKINGLASSVGNLMAAFGVSTGLYLFVDVVKGIYETTKALQSMDLALKMVSETPLEFAKNQQFVTEVSEKWGLEIKSLQQTYTQFYTASKGLLTDDSIKTTFEGIAKAGSIMGLSLEQQQAAFYAIDQMMSKGTVTAEELKKQLGNAMPGAIKAAAMAYMELHPAIKSIQEAEKALYEDMKKGAIDSATYVPLIAKNFQILYGIESLNSVHTMQSAQNRLQNSWTEWIRGISSGGTGLKIVVSTVESLAKNLSTVATTLVIGASGWLAYKTAVMLANVQTKLLALTSTTATIATAEQTVVTGFQTAAQVANATATTTATTALQRFNIALKANALGLILTALYLAYEGFSYLTKSVEETTSAIKEKNQAFITNREIVTSTIIDTNSLIKSYENLTKNTNRSTEQQLELNRVTKELAKIVPSAVIGVNQYGEAIKLNTDTIKRYNFEKTKQLELERKTAITIERNAISELVKDIKDKKTLLAEFKRHKGEGSITQEQIDQQELALSMAEQELIMSASRLVSLKTETEAEKNATKAKKEATKAGKDAIVKDVKWYDAQIKLLKDKEEKLSDVTGLTGKKLKNEIDELQKKRDKIAGEEPKVNKARLKAERDANKEREQIAKESYEAELSNLERQKELILDLKDAEETSLEDKLFLEKAYAYKQIQIAQFVYDEKVRIADKEIKERKLTSVEGENLKTPLNNELQTSIENAKSESLSRMNKLTEENLKKEDEKTKEWYKNNPPFFVENEDSKKAREETVRLNQKALEDIKNYIASFQIELGQNLGFDETANFFLKMDEDSRTMFDKLNSMADGSKEKQIATFQAIAEAAQETFNFIANASQKNFDEEYARLEKEKDARLAFAGDSDTAKKKIEEDYEKRRKEIAIREFKAKQKMAIVNIAIDTAQAVMAVSAKAQWWQVPLMIALGAVQAGIVASQKVPEYWKGTGNALEGLAYTQERGAEIITDKKGVVKDFGDNKGARLTMMEQGDKVYTADQTKRMMFNKDLNSIMTDNGIANAPQIIVNSQGMTKGEMREVMMETLGSMAVESTVIDANGFKQVISKGHSRTIEHTARITGRGLKIVR